MSEQTKRPSESHSSNEAKSKRLKETMTTADSNMAAVDDSEKANTANPISILSNDSCKVQTMTVSDQHATLLLTYDDNDKKSSSEKNANANEETSEKTDSAKPVVRSLLKLTVVPFHKALLGSNPVYSPSDDAQKPELKLLDHDPVASANIATFLKDYKYKLKSESGAEYSYYTASPSSNLYEIPKAQTCKSASETSTEENTSEAPDKIPSPFNTFGSFDVELISPATERQIYRAMPSVGSSLINETPDLYQKVVHPYIKTIVDGDSLGWINNVIEVKKEKERLIVNSPQFIVNIDTKWRSHPPPLTTPRKEWYCHPSVEDLYCLGIVKEKGIFSLRDLKQDHISLLKNMYKEGTEAIEKVYGVKSDQIRCFVHYQPQFYHFHVHFTRLENEIGSTVERGHLLTDIVQNLEMDPAYYQKRTITYKLKKLTPLHNLIQSYMTSEEVKK